MRLKQAGVGAIVAFYCACSGGMLVINKLAGETASAALTSCVTNLRIFASVMAFLCHATFNGRLTTELYDPLRAVYHIGAPAFVTLLQFVATTITVVSYIAILVCQLCTCWSCMRCIFRSGCMADVHTAVLRANQ